MWGICGGLSVWMANVRYNSSIVDILPWLIRICRDYTHTSRHTCIYKTIHTYAHTYTAIRRHTHNHDHSHTRTQLVCEKYELVFWMYWKELHIRYGVWKEFATYSEKLRQVKLKYFFNVPLVRNIGSYDEYRSIYSTLLTFEITYSTSQIRHGPKGPCFCHFNFDKFGRFLEKIVAFW